MLSKCGVITHTHTLSLSLSVAPPTSLPPLSLFLSFPSLPLSPSLSSLVPDAEIMYLVSELISELPGLQEGQYRVLISHTSLLSSLLSYCSVPRHRHKELNNLLQKITVRMSLLYHYKYMCYRRSRDSRVKKYVVHYTVYYM